MIGDYPPVLQSPDHREFYHAQGGWARFLLEAVVIGASIRETFCGVYVIEE